MKTTAQIQADFDKIARVDRPDEWNHNNHYHGFLLSQLPARCQNALEVGCGTGAFARLLAARADHVLALDLSAAMLSLARERSAAFPNIEYVQADVLDYPLPADHFDCIASIATLHHLALAEVLPILKAALKPGGVLLVLDLREDGTISDRIVSGLGLLQHLTLKQIKHVAPATPESRAAWDAHGRDERYPTVNAVRQACADLLPGARVTRHLLWRYSLVWRK